ncbi:Mitochondrial fission process protein 1 [Phytophthora pseudosyringae]|uniref:Mitochondrial fission process protein 1 n=1 Tax=Phytophthora pseudosyringae TaxID=221518 RepID=A0A8T1V248_9STRA|nr:Mitochondrial fission process protein 1 [Phytophthora pseudosyringae]
MTAILAGRHESRDQDKLVPPNTSTPSSSHKFPTSLNAYHSNCRDDVRYIADQLVRPPLVSFTTRPLFAFIVPSYLTSFQWTQAFYHRLHRSCRLEIIGRYQALFDCAFSLIIQRPRFAGGLQTIPLDATVELLQGSTKDIAHNIIRLQYGPKGKHLVLRASSSFERKGWVIALVDPLAAHDTSKAAAPPTTRTSKTIPPTTLRASSSTSASPITHGSHQAVSNKTIDDANVASPNVPQPPLNSLDAAKRLAEGYDSLALQWAQVATETRQFNAEISGLQPSRVDSEHCTAPCVC